MSSTVLYGLIIAGTTALLLNNTRNKEKKQDKLNDKINDKINDTTDKLGQLTGQNKNIYNYKKDWFHLVKNGLSSDLNSLYRGLTFQQDNIIREKNYNNLGLTDMSPKDISINDITKKTNKTLQNLKDDARGKFNKFNEKLEKNDEIKLAKITMDNLEGWGENAAQFAQDEYNELSD